MAFRVLETQPQPKPQPQPPYQHQHQLQTHVPFIFTRRSFVEIARSDECSRKKCGRENCDDFYDVDDDVEEDEEEVLKKSNRAIGNGPVGQFGSDLAT